MVSWTWKYFKKVNDKYACCNVNNCNKTIARSGGTKGLSSHLNLIHKIFEISTNNLQSKSGHQNGESSKRQNDENIEERDEKKQKTMLDFVKFTTLEETLARLAAESGLTLRQITKTHYLRKCLMKDFPNENIPQNQSGMMGLIMKYYRKAKDETILKINQMKSKSKKFSASLDEWTSLKNSRYLNVNIHFAVEEGTKHINLGLVHIEGSCPAEKIKSLVNLFHLCVFF